MLENLKETAQIMNIGCNGRLKGGKSGRYKDYQRLIYWLFPEAYEQLVSGKVIIRDSMIDLFCMGGDFDVYIAMIGIVPSAAAQSNFLMFLIGFLSTWMNGTKIIFM